MRIEQLAYVAAVARLGSFRRTPAFGWSSGGPGPALPRVAARDLHRIFVERAWSARPPGLPEAFA
jgi:hypothetical protein